MSIYNEQNRKTIEKELHSEYRGTWSRGAPPEWKVVIGKNNFEISIENSGRGISDAIKTVAKRLGYEYTIESKHSWETNATMFKNSVNESTPIDLADIQKAVKEHCEDCKLYRFSNYDVSRFKIEYGQSVAKYNAEPLVKDLKEMGFNVLKNSHSLIVQR